MKPGEPVDWDVLPAVLSVNETARILRMGRACCYEALRQGQIPGRKFGWEWRIPKEALRRYLAGEDLNG